VRKPHQATIGDVQTRGYPLDHGDVLIIREALPQDAPRVIAFAEATSRESDFLSFGPGEFGYTDAQERVFIRDCEASNLRLFLLGEIDDELVSVLTFSAGDRPRNRHSGEFGVSVRKAAWGRSIGSLMIDSLISWARSGGVITKLNLRVRTDHTRAIDLYTRKGFTVEGTITRAVRINGQYFDQSWMGLML
jgi:RimJ/RimL family protein N-acetyltransferase